ncbi:MAG: peptidylprolyl isomerase [Deltaproteobacteria bacterium]|nr:peptidylprolyl isomerase [Deltaproteobacteria bacterium]
MTNLEIRGQESRIGVFSFCLLSTFCILSVVACKKHEEEKKLISPADVVIRINDKEITYGGFHDIFKSQFLEGEGAAEIKEEELKDLKKALVNQIIEEELMLEEANRVALTVSEKEFSKEMEEIKKEYSGDSFESTIMNRYGSLDKWKEEIRKKLLIRKIVDEAITSKILVKEGEARKYYKENSADYNVKEQVRARMIVVKTEEEASKVRERLKKGEDFAKVAEEVSLGPEAKKGGDLGFFGRGEMPKEFEDVVFSLPSGKISDIVKTVYGYHIFRVEDKRKAKSQTFSEVKKEIIEKLRREKSDMEFQAWMKELKQKARIEVKEELL